MQYIQTTQDTSLCQIQLKRPPVNAINHQLVMELQHALKACAEKKLAVLITGAPGIFSAGLDVIELFGYDRAQMRAFFEDFMQLHQDIVCYPEPLVVAITGHCPAGGTVLALGADWRVMADGAYQIGLNEMAVNIQITEALIRGYSFWLGEGQAHQAIIEGKLFIPEEALKLGLIQEVTDLESVEQRAAVKIQQYLHLDRQLFRQTKSKLRKNWIDIVNASNLDEIAMTEANWWRPDIRKKMEYFVASLQSKKR